MTWTKKHDEFCLEQKLRPSTILMLRWILRRANNQNVCEIEVDLRLFNTWIAKKRGTPYDRKTIREAIAQLDESTQGLVLIAKEYTPWVKTLVVRPLSFVLTQKAQNQGNTPKIEQGNPMYDNEHKERAIKQQQQNISKLDALFTKVGIKYDQHALKRVWQLAGKSMANIVESVELLLHRHRTQEKPIKNPQGFILDCLRFGWHQGFDLYYQAELPFFESGSAIAQFVRGIIPDKSPVCQT